MAGEGGRTAAVVGWCLLLLSLTAPATAQGAPSMTVSYPEKWNFSHVKLTCAGNLGDPLTAAKFARNDSGVYSLESFHCISYQPSAHMRSEGCSNCFLCVCLSIYLSVCLLPL